MGAGVAEFSEHGIAGARMERLAKRAGVSVGLAYTYFENKVGLFNAILDEVVKVAETSLPIDAAHLDEYAGVLYDSLVEHPHIARIVEWYRLEHDRTEPHPATVAATQDKIAAIEKAQKDGLVTTRYDARQILLLVQGTARIWNAAPPDVFDQLASADDHARRRATIVQAVRDLVAP